MSVSLYGNMFQNTTEPPKTKANFTNMVNATIEEASSHWGSLWFHGTMGSVQPVTVLVVANNEAGELNKILISSDSE